MGDSKTGEKMHDETIKIDFDLLDKKNFDATYIAVLINDHKGMTFQSVKNTKVIVNQGGDVLKEHKFGGEDSGGNACLAGIFCLKNGKWSYKRLHDEYSAGMNWNDVSCTELCMRNMEECGLKQKDIVASTKWNIQKGKEITIKKGGVLILPDSLNHFQIGLGWNVSGSNDERDQADCDAAVLFLDKSGKEVDTVYYNRRKTQGATHTGDNKTGKGSGDDESIEIYLDQLDDKVKFIVPTITIYSEKDPVTKLSKKQFDDVSGAYCRIYGFDGTKKKKFCKQDLSNNKDGISNGIMICVIQKSTEKIEDSDDRVYWSFKELGFYTADTNSPDKMIKPVVEVLSNNTSNVTNAPGNNAKNNNNEDLGNCMGAMICTDGDGDTCNIF